MSGKTALLICGAGSRGIIQLGMLKAIKDLNIHYDAVYAGSVGALNGMLFLQDEMDKLEDMWLTVRNQDVYTARLLSLWKLFTNDASVHDSAPLEKLIRKYLNLDKIKSLPIPFIVNATNLSTYKTEAKDMRTLELEGAVRWIKASASPPILFPSVTQDACEYIDSGILNNYFINQTVKDGYETLICLTPTNAPMSKLRNLLNIIEATISTSSYGYLDREKQSVDEINREIKECGKDQNFINLIIIRPPVPWSQGLIDFNYKEDRKSLIQYGYNLAYEKLKGGTLT